VSGDVDAQNHAFASAHLQRDRQDSTNASMNNRFSVDAHGFTGDVPPGYTGAFDWTPKIVDVIAPVIITSTLRTGRYISNTRNRLRKTLARSRKHC